MDLSRLSKETQKYKGVFVSVPDKGKHEWDFNSMADKMLYQAKSNGRNCYRIGSEFEQ